MKNASGRAGGLPAPVNNFSCTKHYNLCTMEAVKWVVNDSMYDLMYLMVNPLTLSMAHR